MSEINSITRESESQGFEFSETDHKLDYKVHGGYRGLEYILARIMDRNENVRNMVYDAVRQFEEDNPGYTHDKSSQKYIVTMTPLWKGRRR